MNLRKAIAEDLQLVKNITHTTILAIYPGYYPAGAVTFCLKYHSDEHIAEDIEAGRVYLLEDGGLTVATITLKENEICRLFVLPEHEHKGYGKYLLNFAEETLFKDYEEVRLDASYPAKAMYYRHGYYVWKYDVFPVDYGHNMCYDIMKKNRP